MSLRATFDISLGTPSGRLLEEIDATVWEQLLLATRMPRHPWLYSAFCTLEIDSPQSRVVVLRSVDRDQRVIRFFTDLRSPKIQNILENPKISWLLFDATSLIQVRLQGEATIASDRQMLDACWESVDAVSRRNYMGLQPPSSSCNLPSANLSPEFVVRVPTLEETEPAIENFAVVETVIHSMEWLYLKPSGHLRMSARYWPHHELTWLEP
ncbi:MAG: pyridoxamine 5'-phosphate oxidase family protein [Planctomycetales bacterium]|nr:pyridoxamine 5'-phosphate oxidase family protein [Planctomycetales bacterium]